MGLPLLPTPSTSTASPPSRTPVSCSGQATPVYCGGLYPSDTCSRAQAVMLGRGASAGDPQPEDSPKVWPGTSKTSPYKNIGTLASCQGAKSSQGSH